MSVTTEAAPAAQLTKKELDKARGIAAAAIEKRRREGTWGGAVKAHTAYARRPLEWIVAYLEVPEETLRWSMHEAYETHCVPEGDVLTPSGWVDIRTMKVGDPVYTVDSNGCMVESVVGQVHKGHYTGKLVQVNGRRFRALATPGHNVAKLGPSSLRARYPRVGRTRNSVGIRPIAEEVAQRRSCTYEAARTWSRKLRARGYSDGQITDIASTDRTPPHHTLVPIAEFPRQSEVSRIIKWQGYPIDDIHAPHVKRTLALGRDKAPQPTSLSPTQYAALLGWYLAEGSCVDRDKAVAIAQMKPEWRAEIERLLDDCGFRYSSTCKQFTIYAPRWWKHFKRFGKAADKYIPEHIKQAPPDVLEALFRAMMGGDGHWRSRYSSGTYTSISKRLADDFGEVALRLGYSVFQSEKCGDGTRQKQYRVNITTKPTVWPGREFVQEVEHDGPVYCIGVPGTNTFLIRQHGSVWVSGNSWDGDEDPFVQVLEALANWEDCGIESATGVGKTFVAACITLWFLACHEGALVAQWAPKEDQLLDFMWKEIKKLFPKFKKQFPTAELYTGLLRMAPPSADGEEAWAAKAYVAGVKADEESATKAQGFHGVHTLHITEETPGIPAPIMVAIKETRTANHNLHLALGNPDHRHDQLHRFCMRKRVKHIRISALDFPNVVAREQIVPGAVDYERLQERIEDLELGSGLYLSRIRGISPSQAADALIRYEWCELAASKYKDDAYRLGVEARGVDVANSPKGDKAAIARWQGACLTDVEDFQCEDANLLGLRVYTEALEGKIDPRYIGVDPVGVGAGCVNELKRLGMKVRSLGGANKAIPGLDKDTLWSETSVDMDGHERAAGPTVIEAERFDNLRSQMWWRLREDMRLGKVAMVEDEELFSDLTLPTFTTVGGKISVQSKKELFKTLKRSPNKGDAAVYGNWVRRREPIIDRTERPMESTANRDRGLDRFLRDQEKRQIKEQREIMKRLKQRHRARRRR